MRAEQDMSSGDEWATSCRDRTAPLDHDAPSDASADASSDASADASADASSSSADVEGTRAYLAVPDTWRAERVPTVAVPRPSRHARRPRHHDDGDDIPLRQQYMGWTG